MVFAALWDSTEHPGAYDFEWLVVLFFQVPVVISMMINTWLLLRHPDSYHRRTLPRRLSISLVLLWGVLILWASLFPTNTTWLLGFLFGIAVMILSILGVRLRRRAHAHQGGGRSRHRGSVAQLSGRTRMGLLRAGGAGPPGGRVLLADRRRADRDARDGGLLRPAVVRAATIIGMAGYVGGSIVYGIVVAGLGSALTVLFNVGAVLMLLLRPRSSAPGS